MTSGGGSSCFRQVADFASDGCKTPLNLFHLIKQSVEGQVRVPKRQATLIDYFLGLCKSVSICVECFDDVLLFITSHEHKNNCPFENIRTKDDEAKLVLACKYLFTSPKHAQDFRNARSWSGLFKLTCEERSVAIDLLLNSDSPRSSPAKLHLLQYPSVPIPCSSSLSSTLSVYNAVETSTTMDNLNRLYLAVQHGDPVMLEGPCGSGKSLLIQELAHFMKKEDIVELQLDDQMDSKTLLGTYICSEIPGEFHWQPGALTLAVLKGRWVLIEDIDRAPFEILAALLPLFENGSLLLPNRDQVITTAPGFQLFATRRSRPSVSTILDHCFSVVEIKPLTKPELRTVALSKTKLQESLVDLLLKTFWAMSNPQDDLPIDPRRSLRSVSERDFFKWLGRVGTLVTLQDRDFLTEENKECILVEAVDCFIAGMPNKTERLLMAKWMSNVWGLDENRLSHRISVHKPTVVLSDDTVSVGRVRLSLNEGEKHQKPAFSTKVNMRLLEQLAVGVKLREPVLLVGETGVGKTWMVQYLASLLNRKLVVQNMHIQSDSTELVGGYKPVQLNYLAVPLYNRFVSLFCNLFKESANQKFLKSLRDSMEKHKWKKLVRSFMSAINRAEAKLQDKKRPNAQLPSSSKSRKTTFSPAGSTTTSGTSLVVLDKEKCVVEWEEFKTDVETFDRQRKRVENSFAFTFEEGTLIRALREGHWVLLDEVNLASSETLERLTSLLDDKDGTLSLTERGDLESVVRHPNFRLFAAMNPATDFGKKDLPPALRNRFTELYVDELVEPSELQLVVSGYFCDIPAPPVDTIVKLYLDLRRRSNQQDLLDGANQPPKYSLRTLCRALSTSRLFLSRGYGLARSLFESFQMTFSTLLSNKSRKTVVKLFRKAFVPTMPQKQLQTTPRFSAANKEEEYVLCENYWVRRGTLEIDHSLPVITKFIKTASVVVNIENLSRAIAAHKYPILLQGPTSSGKTTMVNHLAARTGNHYVRINNHEHTDLQEYMGSYVSDDNGTLVFQEGVLVKAVRCGHWIVLDELNLAPSEVLEALNRLLDDNRELFIPETQETIKPHPNFMLFATQNPPGVYGGRKILSRAFRNRFIELHVDDIPSNEMEVILNKRCELAPPFCTVLVKVMNELQLHRQQSKLFAGKDGFITTRDLLRWANRGPPASYEELAIEGFRLLGDRVRFEKDKTVVKCVIEKHCKTELTDDKLYPLPPHGNSGSQEIVWTSSMRRLYGLILRCVEFKEPALLVGETGVGKTTVCQVLAQDIAQQLVILNCHQNTDTADILGSLRPVRGKGLILKSILSILQEENTSTSSIEEIQQLMEGKVLSDRDIETISKLTKQYKSLFEWADGPLVSAMKNGDMFLLDELSLAEDAVLERLNSVLEPSRSLLLAEKGTSSSIDEVVAHEKFRIVGTMNPGGDFGKRELSPALRNRFTEIWIPPINQRHDLELIVGKYIEKDLAAALVDFYLWFNDTIQGDFKIVQLTLRDVISWANFIVLNKSTVDEWLVYVHGASMVLLDGLGLGSGASLHNCQKLRKLAYEYCVEQIPDDHGMRGLVKTQLEGDSNKVSVDDEKFHVGLFEIPLGNAQVTRSNYSFEAPTTKNNLAKVIRAMQLNRPILLEGSPGVGKTSLIQTLADSSGHQLVRINLSEQTDFADLIGSDIPQPDATDNSKPSFVWSDGVFLTALKTGSWVLLDELNLASQSVLEGLNACLDHRATIYVPELDESFNCPSSFRVFAAQNPLIEGGGRKGLPKSFLNRFTKVYVDSLSNDDYHEIIKSIYPEMDDGLVECIIEFNSSLVQDVIDKKLYGVSGAPWEFNLRDIFRLCDLAGSPPGPQGILDNVSLVYIDRLRTSSDRSSISKLFEKVFHKYGLLSEQSERIDLQIGDESIKVGSCEFAAPQSLVKNNRSTVFLPRVLLKPLEHLTRCVQRQWPVLLTGSSGSGKKTIIRYLASLYNKSLHEFPICSSTDSTELLGCFEQCDVDRQRKQYVDDMLKLVELLLHESKNAAACVLLEDLRSSLMKLMNGGDTHAQLVLECIPELQSLLPNNPVVQNLSSMAQSEPQVTSGAFVWVDGTLVNAMERGDWVMLYNSNLCNPTVLDRLNPLLEPSGELMINECGNHNGKPRIIKPHKDFRLFLVMDPQFGEVSRAMRNRCVEIALLDVPFQDILGTGDARRLLVEHLEINSQVADIMLSVPEAEEMTLQTLNRWGSMFRTCVFMNGDLYKALELSYCFVFQKQLSSSAFDSAKSEVEFFSSSGSILKGLALTRTWKLEPRLSILNSGIHGIVSDWVNDKKGLILALEQMALNIRDMMGCHQSDFFSNVVAVLSDGFCGKLLSKALSCSSSCPPRVVLFKKGLENDTNPGSLANAAMLSATGQLPKNELIKTPFVSFILQFLETFDDLVMENDNAMRSLSGLLGIRWHIWRQLNVYALDDVEGVAVFSILLRWLIKEVVRIKFTVSDKLLHCLARLESQLEPFRSNTLSLFEDSGIAEYSMMSIKQRKTDVGVKWKLWKLISKPKPMKSKELFDVNERIRLLSTEDKTEEENLITSVSPRDKLIMVDAICTLEFLNFKNSMDEMETIAKIAHQWEKRCRENIFVALRPLIDDWVCKEMLPSVLILALGRDATDGEAREKNDLDYAVEISSLSPMDLAPFQDALWRLSKQDENDEIVESTISPMLQKYYSSMWRMNQAGPGLLFQDMESYFVKELLSGSGVGVEVACMYSNPSIVTIRNRSLRLSQIQMCLVHLLEKKESEQNIAAELDKAVFQYTLKTALRSVVGETDDGDVADRLRSLNVDLVNRTLVPLVDELNTMSIGKSWVLLSLFCLHALLPRTCLDPSIKTNTKLSLKQELLGEKESIMRIRELNDSKSGTSVGVVKTEKEQVEQLRLDIAVLNGKVVYRPQKLEKFVEFYHLVHEFVSTMGSLDRVLTFVNDENHDGREEEEFIWQESALQLCQRLENHFHGYDDLTYPFHVSLLQLKHGLRLFVLEQQSKANKRMSDCCRVLSSFPLTVYGIDSIAHPTQLGALESVLSPIKDEIGSDKRKWTKVLKSVYERALVCFQYGEIDWDLFDKLLSLFTREYSFMMEEKKSKEEEAGVFKFTTRKNDEENDDESFREMFPDFHTEFHKLLEEKEDEDEMEVDQQEEEHEDQEDRLILDRGSFISIVTSALDTILDKRGDNKNQSGFCLGYQAARMLQEGKSLDSSEFAHSGGSLYALSLSIQDCTSHFAASEVHDDALEHLDLNYDPYHEEVSLLEVPLNAFSRRLDSLLKQFPENAFLIRLGKLVDSLRNLPISCPLMRALVGLETLLKVSNDWESVASKAVSIETELKPLVALVIRWRKLELRSWPLVLEKKEVKYQHEEMLWFYNVYAILDGSNDPFKVFEALDQFLRTSTLGSFLTRVELLRSIRVVLMNLDGVATVKNMMFYIVEYYLQYANDINATLARSKKPIEKELKGETKLAKWDDRNYFSLKESADKSHRILHKLSKDYQELLETPVYPTIEYVSDSRVKKHDTAPDGGNIIVELDDIAEGSFKSNVVAIKDYCNSDNSFETPNGYGLRLPKLLKRVYAIVSGDVIEPLLSWKESCTSPDNLNRSIIDRIKSLRNPKVPQSAKQRALTDLFKTFRSEGIINARPDNEFLFAKEENRCMSLLFSTCVPASEKCDRKFFECLAQLHRYRHSLSIGETSPDITMLQYKRGLRLIEGVFEQLIDHNMVRTRVENTAGGVIQSVLLLGEDFVLSPDKLERIETIRDVMGSVDLMLHEIHILQTSLISRDKQQFEVSTEYDQVRRLVVDHNAKSLVVDGFDGSIQALSSKLKDMVRGLSDTLKKKNSSRAAEVARAEELSVIKKNIEQDVISRVHEFVPRKCIQELRHLLSLLDFGFLEQEAPADESDLSVVDTFVETILLTIQNLRSSLIHFKEDFDRRGSCSLSDYNARLLHLLSLLNIDKVASVTQAALVHITKNPNLRNLLATYNDLCQNLVALGRNHSYSTSRLCFLLLRVFRTLCSNGYCKSEEEEDGSNDDDFEGEDQDGVGMGEGKGTEDVSNEIEDEEQLLGEKKKNEEQDHDEEQEQAERKEEEDNNEGIEMENEFEGEMFDINQDKKDNEDEEEEKEEDEEELDREMGDLDRENEQVVDEKLWDDQEDEKQQDDDELFEKDAPMSGENQDDELRAKDDDEGEEEEKKEEKKEKDDGGEKQQEQEGEKKEEEEEELNEDMEDRVDDGQAVEDRHQDVDVNEEDKEEFELPEDLQIQEDDEGEPEDDDAQENDDDGDDQEVEKEQEETIQEDANQQEEEAEQDRDQDGQQAEEEAHDMDNNNEEESEEKNDTEGAQLNLPDNSMGEEPEQDKAYGTDAPKPGQEDEEQEKEKKDGSNTSSDQQQEEEKQETTGEKDSSTGKGDSAMNDDENITNDTSTTQKQEDDENMDVDDQQTREVDNTKREQPNPWTNPGDSSKQWHRRLQVLNNEEVESEQQEEEELNKNDNDEKEQDSKAFEFSQNEDESTTQVLAPSAEQKVSTDQEEEDSEEKDMNVDENVGKDEEEDIEEEEENSSNNSNKRSRDNESHSDTKKPKLGEEPGEDGETDKQRPPEEGAEEDEDSMKDEVENQPTKVIASNMNVLNDDDDEDEEDVEMAPSREVCELGENEPDFELWNELCLETKEGTLRLCEQLRLILEPTLASKLRGDYRTGKRLNLRRVIPYIASQFRKDKIWLRRTKPSKRDYHIVLAIDDSYSMSPAGRLALMSMCTLSKAMNKLEIGQLGILKFGQTVNVLNNLNEPFTDAVGARIVSQFGFSQESTCIEAGIETITSLLLNARNQLRTSASGCKVEFRQLAFFISDGRFDSSMRDRVQKMIRDAIQQRILIVLIIVENQQEESILTTRQVSFVKGKVQISSYLDEYPFPLYIILQKPSELPEVLADALRQWFELLSVQSD